MWWTGRAKFVGETGIAWHACVLVCVCVCGCAAHLCACVCVLRDKCLGVWEMDEMISFARLATHRIESDPESRLFFVSCFSPLSFPLLLYLLFPRRCMAVVRETDCSFFFFFPAPSKALTLLTAFRSCCSPSAAF